MDSSAYILVAEDNQADVQIIREILTQHGRPHRLDVVSDGEEALRLAGSFDGQPPCPDLFVLDLHLPKVDGPEVLRRFRANKNCAQTPVIVLSSFLSPRDRAEIGGLDGVSCLSKPATLEEVSKMGQLIHSILDRPKPRTKAR